MIIEKSPQDSFTQMTELVLPNDTNTLGNLMGGRLMHWMDIVSAIAAGRHSNQTVVTAAVDYVEFRSPIRLGELVILKAQVTRAFTSSMEVKIDALAENWLTAETRVANSAYYTFVAVDKNGKPLPVNTLTPQTDREKKLHESAMRRRELRLILAGRMKPEEATLLKKIFLTD